MHFKLDILREDLEADITLYEDQTGAGGRRRCSNIVNVGLR